MPQSDYASFVVVHHGCVVLQQSQAYDCRISRHFVSVELWHCAIHLQLTDALSLAVHAYGELMAVYCKPICLHLVALKRYVAVFLSRAGFFLVL